MVRPTRLIVCEGNLGTDSLVHQLAAGHAEGRHTSSLRRGYKSSPNCSSDIASPCG